MALDDKKPYATNSFGSYGMFYNRELYKTKSYPELEYDVQPIDLWYKQGFYGRLDRIGNPIQVNQFYLKEIQSKKTKNIFVLNFVADAFEDLRKYMTEAAFQNKIDAKDTYYYDLQPVLGWASVETEFDNYLQVVYDVFFESFMANQLREQRMTSFSSFLQVFSNFVEQITPKFMFTQTAFVGSRYGTPLTSGLMLELELERHDDDKIKYNKFIKDKNFTFFTRAALKFGFLVDKNAPWRIVADLGSSVMKKYMGVHDLTLDNLFHVAYSPTYESDIPVLKNYLLRFYNSYITAKPEVRIVKPSTFNRHSLTTIIYKRIKINDINPKEFDDNYWLKYYAFLRAKELGRTWRQITFDRLTKTAEQLHKFKNYETALEYLNRRLRGKQPEFLALTNAATHDKIEFDFLKSSTFQGFRLL